MTSRGRAYKCLRCNSFTGERSKVVSHFYKHHISLEEAPFYCTLCLFRTERQRELTRHVRGFIPHKQRQAAMKTYVESEFLKTSSKPYLVCEGRDIERLGQLESSRLWEERKRKPKEADLLTSILNEAGLDLTAFCSPAVPVTNVIQPSSEVDIQPLDLTPTACTTSILTPIINQTSMNVTTAPDLTSTNHITTSTVAALADDQPLDLTSHKTPIPTPKRKIVSDNIDSPSKRQKIECENPLDDMLSEGAFSPNYSTCSSPSTVSTEKESPSVISTKPSATIENQLGILENLRTVTCAVAELQKTVKTLSDVVVRLTERQTELEKKEEDFQASIKDKMNKMIDSMARSSYNLEILTERYHRDERYGRERERERHRRH
jgi:hypothetical protein